MTASSAADSLAPTTTLRAESEAVYSAAAAGVLGALYGLIVAFVAPDLPLAQELQQIGEDVEYAWRDHLEAFA